MKRYGPRSTIAVVGRPTGRTVVPAARKKDTLPKPSATPAAIAINAAINKDGLVSDAIGHGRLECTTIAVTSGNAKMTGGGTNTPAWSFGMGLAD